MQCKIEHENQVISAIQFEIDIILAALLLTGQITVIRVYVIPGGFGFSLGGPLTGRSRLEGRSKIKAFSFAIDLLDILLAILLLTRKITFEGLFVGPGRFSFNVSGPIFGIPKPQPVQSEIEKISKEFRGIVAEHFM
ncbi:hypothetical protein [Peribacillus deserti]|uniref:Uncharacterized protein n=1 Tax=Peribacillus deserti TaxID=673318 RepID=A0A2N5M2H1_9BACI|nr:hypothetical protein [Peribacillus deserti]PLT28515.1 hypothetical protein CUU66_18120 [Peribacillus deserti]